MVPAAGRLKLHGGRIEFLSKRHDAAQERFRLRSVVVDGGLELASARHILVADASTCYALPEGSFHFQAHWVAQLKLPAVALVA